MDPIYVVTDVEFDGPVPGRHSLLSFASAAVSANGERRGIFEAVLVRLEGSQPDPETALFWRNHPEAWAAATTGAQLPELVMSRFVSWVRALPGEAIFAAHPLALDGPWIDYYLQRFTGERLIEGPWRPHRLFRHPPLCLMSFAAGRLGWPSWECDVDRYPPEWLGDRAHTHRAIEDASGYAHLLAHLLSTLPSVTIRL